MPKPSPSNLAQPRASKRATSFEPQAAAAFGSVIREARVAQGMAQDQFALLANVDRSYYGKLERGERQPSLALIIRIASGLGMTASDIIGRVEARISG